jgi:cellulose biosynthesis protein BcsQ
MKKAKKIFVGNYKGGVGKTTSIYQIARQAVLKSKRVLLIDLDPQCSLSEICMGGPHGLEQLASNECLNYIYDMWLQVKAYPNIQYQLKRETLVKSALLNMDFIPSNIFYENGGLDDLAMNMSNNFEDLLVLQQFMEKQGLENEYDYILFDCPPSNNIITQGAFLLSDYYLIPTIFQTMSIRGVVHYITTVEKIYKKYCEDGPNSVVAKLLFGEKPKLLGIFETLKKGTVNNETVHLDFTQALQTANVKTQLMETGKGQYIFPTIISNYEVIARDTAIGKIRDEYREIANEIFDCIS